MPEVYITRFYRKFEGWDSGIQGKFGSLSFLTRPKAATKYPRLVEAARFQPSAFSAQLLNKHRKHAFDFYSLLHQFLIVIGRHKFQITSQEKLIFQLAG